MKVRDLVNMLKLFDPESIVLVERSSELRELHEEDVRSMLGPIQTDDGDEIDGQIVIFGSWN